MVLPHRPRRAPAASWGVGIIILAGSALVVLADGSAAEVVVPDPTGDVALVTDTQSVPLNPAGPQFGHMDLVEVRFAISNGTFLRISFETVRWAEPGEPLTANAWLGFALRNTSFTSRWNTSTCGENLEIYALIDGHRLSRGCVELHAAEHGPIRYTEIPFARILGEDGRPPEPGDLFHGLYVELGQNYTGGSDGAISLLPGSRFVDRAPDSGHAGPLAVPALDVSAPGPTAEGDETDSTSDPAPGQGPRGTTPPPPTAALLAAILACAFLKRNGWPRKPAT